MNSGKVKVRGGWMQLHSPGTADILVFPQGRIVWLETKDPKGSTHKEQVKAQADFRDRVMALGHEYYRITSTDEGIEKVKNSN